MDPNMHITSVKTKTAGVNPQQARYELFRERIASVLTSPTDPKPATIKNTRNLSQITSVRTENAQQTYQTCC
jgi:hypothetical protein